MKTTQCMAIAAALATTFTLTGCTPPAPETVLREYPIQSLDGLIASAGLELDTETTRDGNGALRISATSPTTVPLYETGDLDAEAVRLFYRARLRTRDLKGKAYLEMWCVFGDKGQYFSRGLQATLSGTTDWTTVETPFFLKPGQNPDNVKLNLVIDGSGTVWIDDIQLVTRPLQ